MGAELRVGVIDSGCSPDQAAGLLGARRFWLDDGVLREGEALADQLGHGTAVLARLRREASRVPVLMAQVFQQHGSTSALQVAAALLWLVEQGVSVVNLSLGLHQDRPVLRQACAEAQAAGVLLCASSPARACRCIRPIIRGYPYHRGCPLRCRAMVVVEQRPGRFWRAYGRAGFCWCEHGLCSVDRADCRDAARSAADGRPAGAGPVAPPRSVYWPGAPRCRGCLKQRS